MKVKTNDSDLGYTLGNVTPVEYEERRKHSDHDDSSCIIDLSVKSGQAQ
jgi:hypothetical protein